MIRRAATCLLLALALPAQNRSIPSQAELEAARSGALRVMVDRVVRKSGGDRALASTELMAAAFDAPDRATRYLLWQEAIQLAGQTDNIELALQHQQCFATEFGLDPVDGCVGLLKHLADRTGDPLRQSAIGIAALHRAHSHCLLADERPMLAFYDVAVRATLRADHAPLYGFVRDQLSALRASAVITDQLRASMHDSPFPLGAVTAGLLQGEIRMFEPFELGDFAGVFESLQGFERDRSGSDLTADEMLQLSDRARHRELGQGLLRCALRRLVRDYAIADEDKRRSSCRSIVALAERLCTLDGFSRLRFRDPESHAQLARANGEWTVADGKLIGKAKGADNYATHRIRYANTNVCVIRGGIRSPQGLNFRCKVGDVNLLLNWEVEPQNHLWLNGACHRKAPRALTPGEEHTIVIFSDGANAHVCIDDVHWWTVPSQLRGTVSVYPALDSEIFVREILVDGNPAGLVDAPVGVMM